MGRKAPGLATDKGDDAEGAAGIAAVLNFQRGAGVIPFPAQDRGDEDFGEEGDVTALDGSKSDR